MRRLVVDASVALKWILPEPESEQAVQLRRASLLMAPDLLVCECVNALWKHVRRGALSGPECLAGVRLLKAAPIQLSSASGLAEAAAEFALALDHAAYDAFYLALARREECALVTADQALARKLTSADIKDAPEVLSIAEAARRLAPTS